VGIGPQQQVELHPHHLKVRGLECCLHSLTINSLSLRTPSTDTQPSSSCRCTVQLLPVFFCDPSSLLQWLVTE
jgi:hypothetical protein